MLALARTRFGMERVDVRPPSLGPGEVLIRVRLVGLCRTDLAVARGEITVDAPRILGHEMVGEVSAVGPGCRRFRGGESVSVDPVFHCGDCRRCHGDWKYACLRRQFLGVDRDGALAELIVIPEQNVWRISAELDDRASAMLEPMAACAAVLKAPIDRSERGLVVGTGRLAVLTTRALRVHGFGSVETLEDDISTDASDGNRLFDFVIDTSGEPSAVQASLSYLRPQGRLVLKSRAASTLELPLEFLIANEINVHGVNYLDFGKARHLLESSVVEVADLFGPVWPPEDADAAFAAAEDDPFRKHFLVPPGARFTKSYASTDEVVDVRNHWLHL